MLYNIHGHTFMLFLDMHMFPTCMTAFIVGVSSYLHPLIFEIIKMEVDLSMTYYHVDEIGGSVCFNSRNLLFNSS